MHNNTIIDFSKKYTFGQMLDELLKDDSLSFISEGKLYFKRKGKLLIANYKHNNIYDIVHAKNMTLDINNVYYKTNIYISNIIYEINLADVKDNLLDSKTVMLSINERTWIINLEDKIVYLDYSQIENANEDNYTNLFTIDVLASIIEGQWYVIDEDNFIDLT